MNNIKLSTIQEMYDFAKDTMVIQYKSFQFRLLPQDNQFRLTDENYFIQAQVKREAIDIYNQAIVELKKWKLQRNGNQISVIIYELSNLEESYQSPQLEPFVPQIQDTVVKREQKTTKQREKLEQDLQQQEVHQYTMMSNDRQDIIGRVIKKSKKQFKNQCDCFQIEIILPDCPKSLSGIVWDDYKTFYQQINLNGIYRFKNVLVFWDSVCNNQEFKVNKYSFIYETNYTIPYSLEQRLEPITIETILNAKNKDIVDLIAIIKQKIYQGNERITYLVCDMSGSLYLSIWIQDSEHLVKDFKNGEIVVLKGLKFSINDKMEKFLNAGYHTYLIENYESVEILGLKQWALNQNFSQLSLSEPIISQLSDQIQNKQIKPYESHGYIQCESIDQMTYLACSQCSRKMSNFLGWYQCEKMHIEHKTPQKKFFMNVKFVNDKETIQVCIPDQLTVQLLGINAGDFENLDIYNKWEKLQQIMNQQYRIEMYNEEKVIQERLRQRFIVTNIQPILKIEYHSCDENTQGYL